MEDFIELTEQQLDALKEVGTIGAGNGATALSQMLQKRIRMTVPEVRIVPISIVPEAVGGPELVVAGIFTQASGAAPCSTLFVLPIESARILADMLMDRPVGSIVELSDMDKSALAEIANVVSGAYLNSLSDFTEIHFTPSVPALAVDMAGAILNTVLVQAGVMGDHALLLETEFSEIDEKVSGLFLLLPEEGSLEKIMNALGVD